MTTFKVNVKSRYARGTRLVTLNGITRFKARQTIEAPPRPDDWRHTVKQGERFDTIAWAEMKDPSLGWIVADYARRDGHRIIDPLADLLPGMILRGPGPVGLAEILNDSRVTFRSIY